MKQIAGLLLCVGLLFSVGCSTMSTDQKVALIGVSKAPIAVGVALTVKDNPEAVTYFRLADQVLTSCLDQGILEPTRVKAELDKLVVISDPDLERLSLIALDSVVTFYQATIAEAVKQQVDRDVYLEAALLAARDGVRLGMPQ